MRRNRNLRIRFIHLSVIAISIALSTPFAYARKKATRRSESQTNCLLTMRLINAGMGSQARDPDSMKKFSEIFKSHEEHSASGKALEATEHLVFDIAYGLLIAPAAVEALLLVNPSKVGNGSSPCSRYARNPAEMYLEMKEDNFSQGSMSNACGYLDGNSCGSERDLLRESMTTFLSQLEYLRKQKPKKPVYMTFGSAPQDATRVRNGVYSVGVPNLNLKFTK